MLRSQPRILVLLEIWKWAPALPWLHWESITQLDPFFFELGHMLLCGRTFLGARFRLVSCPRIWERTDCAHEVHTCELTPRDGPFLSRIFDVVPRALGEYDGEIWSQCSFSP